MKSFACVLVIGWLLMMSQNSPTWADGDEDCVEGEEGCSAQGSSESSSSGASVADVQNNILVMNDANFADVLKKEEMIMVTFYAPWLVCVFINKPYQLLAIINPHRYNTIH